MIQADHALRALENATSRIGRAFTVHAEAAPPGAGSTLALEAAETVTPSRWRAGPGADEEPTPYVPAYLLERLRATRLREADLAYRLPGIPGRPAARVGRPAGAGAPRGVRRAGQNLILQAQTFGFDAFGCRSASTARARPRLREIEAVGRCRADRRDLRHLRRGAASRPGSAWTPAQVRGQLDPVAADVGAVIGGPAATAGQPLVLDVVPLFETGKVLQNAASVLDEILGLEPS